MEPESSLPHLQVPTTCPYPEPARSSPYPHIPLPEDPSKYYPPIYACVGGVLLKEMKVNLLVRMLDAYTLVQVCLQPNADKVNGCEV